MDQDFEWQYGHIEKHLRSLLEYGSSTDGVKRGPVKSPLKKNPSDFFIQKLVLRGLSIIPKRFGSSFDHISAIFYSQKTQN